MRIPIACLAILMLLPSTVVLATQEVTTVDRSLAGRRLNELALWDLGSNGVYEIFTTDVSGGAGCYAADTLDPLWELTFASEPLTAPVIGNFMGTGAPVLAFASTSGQVYFVWPGTGETIAKLSTGVSFVLPPSVARHANSDELILADDKGALVGVYLEPTTGLPRESFRLSNSTSDSTAFNVVGSLSQPPTCTDLDGDGKPEVLLASETGLLQVVRLPALGEGTADQKPTRYHTRLPQNSIAHTLAGVGAIAGGHEVLFGYGIGTSIEFNKWDPAAAPGQAISLALRAPAFGNSLGHLLMGDLNGDRTPDVISTADSAIAARYFGSDFAGKPALLDIAQQHLVTARPPYSPALPVTLRSGEKAIVGIDQQGSAFVWQPSSEDNKITRYDGVAVPTSFTPGGDITGSGKLALVIWNDKNFKLSVVTLPVDVAPAATAAPALTLSLIHI